MDVEPAKLRRIRWRLFLAAWLAYAFFHQGGGWSQNARFAGVRALVEQGTFAIDDYLFYSRVVRSGGPPKLERTLIDQATFTHNGKNHVLGWPAERPVAVRDVPAGATVVDMSLYASTGDLAYANGRFYPNKAPGTTLLGVPAYFALYQIERLAGFDPDDWWILTLNAWLTTAFSLGLVSALGVVVFHRVALALWEGRLRAATWSTAAFAFGTLLFPYATMLFEHNVVAVALLVGFGLLCPWVLSAEKKPSRSSLVLAGIALGWASISAYVAIVPVVLILAWSILRSRRVGHLPWLAIGLAVPLGVVCWYNAAAFGTAFTTHHPYQNPYDLGPSLVLGRPRMVRLLGVLVSPFRGLFFSSPVLLAGVAGLVVLARDRTRRPEATLFLAIVSSFLLFNISFQNWYGGWGVGPRYLIPALPFLALATVWGFERWFRTTTALAAISAFTMLAFTAVDPQPPGGASPIASRPGRNVLLRDPLTEHTLPLFFTGTSKTLLDVVHATAVERAEKDLIDQGIGEPEREEQLASYGRSVAEMIAEGSRQIPLSLFRGPVSANPIGLYENWFAQLIQHPAAELGWNSFNAGELVMPRSRASLLFLLLLILPLTTSALASSATERTAQSAEPARTHSLGADLG